MSNSIWKTGDLREASTKKLILYFVGGSRIPYTGWNHPDIMMLSASNESWWKYTDVMRWCYTEDLIAQADKAERLQKALDVAVDAIKNATEYLGNQEPLVDVMAMNLYIDLSKALDKITALEQKSNN